MYNVKKSNRPDEQERAPAPVLSLSKGKGADTKQKRGGGSRLTFSWQGPPVCRRGP